MYTFDFLIDNDHFIDGNYCPQLSAYVQYDWDKEPVNITWKIDCNEPKAVKDMTDLENGIYEACRNHHYDVYQNLNSFFDQETFANYQQSVNW